MDNNNFNFRAFNTPLSGQRFQSQLGKEHRRLNKEGQNVVRMLLARVVKVNYKYNTVDVVTATGKDSTLRSPSDNGRYSARLPIQFGGQTPEGNVYGGTTLVTRGSLVLIGFLEGNKDFPIVLNIYGELDNQSQLTRTTFSSADESEEDIQQELWQLFNLYPSMTYHNVDGRGNQEITFSGKSFLYISESDPENEYIQDAEFDYEHLPSSRYANGDLIEPKSPHSPSLLYVHQGVYDDHRVTFFIKSDGTVRYGSRHLDGEGITYQEMSPDGSYNVTQKHDTTNPEELSDRYATMGFDAEGNLTLKSLTNTLEIRNNGIFLNGVPFGGLSSDRLDRLEEGILDAGTAIENLDGAIRLRAWQTEVDNLTDRVIEQDAELKVAFDEISTRVTRAEYNTLAKGSNNLLHNTSFTDELRPYGEGTELSVRNGEFNELTVRRGGAAEEFGVYLGNRHPMRLVDKEKYTLSFEGSFGSFPEINGLYIVTSDGKQIELDTLEVKEDPEDMWENNLYTLTFTSDKEYKDTAYLLFSIKGVEDDLFSIQKVQLERGEVRTEYYPSFKDFAIANLYETQIRQLADEISLTASAITSVDEKAENAIGRVQEAELKIRPDRISQTVRESQGYIDDILAARNYTDETMKSVDTKIGNVTDSLGNLEDEIKGAFKDGIISEAEAQAIEKYLNTLQTEKEALEEKYNYLMGRSQLTGPSRDNLESRWELYIAAHYNLIQTIEDAIEDDATTAEEAEAVNTAFAEYRRRLNGVAEYMENAVNTIADGLAVEAKNAAIAHTNGAVSVLEATLEVMAGQISARVTEETYFQGISTVRDNAEKYANNLFDPLEKSLDNLTKNYDDLQDYIQESFKDGIITESEAKAIRRYLNLIAKDKADLDAKYDELIKNPDLTQGTSVRNTLISNKGAFDTAFTNLKKAIEDAIEDGFTTEAEARRVDQMFTAYNTTFGTMSRSIEAAINAIAQVKATRAKDEAIKRALEEDGVIKERLEEAEFKITPREITSTVMRSTEYETDRKVLEDAIGDAVNDLTDLANDTGLLEKRVETAEQKITPNSITSTVRNHSTYQNDLTSVRNNAKSDAQTLVNTAKSDLNKSIETISTNYDNLQDYLEESFRDGVITEAEAKAIRKYLNLIDKDKSDLDAKYAELNGNSDLASSSEPARNLVSAKNAFNTAYDNLRGAINTAIAGGKTSQAEAARVDQMFTAYNTALANLSRRIEAAINHIAQTKAGRAESNANSYTNGVKGELIGRIEEAEFKVTPGQIIGTVTQTSQWTGLSNTATKGVNDAAAAHARANTGVNNAATAQARADKGVSDAATAQARANTGVNNAATAQARADKGVNDAATAQTQANKGVNDAAAASRAAGTAQSTADTANRNLGTLTETMTSQFEQTAEAIRGRVSYTDYTGKEIVSRMSLDAERFSIEARLIDFTIGEDDGAIRIMGPENSDGEADVITELSVENRGFDNLYIGSLRSPSVMNFNEDNYTLYVNPVTGDDGRDGRSWGQAFQSLQAAINSIPKFNNGRVEIEIFIDGGRGVDLDENIWIDGFMGSGTIYVHGRHRNNKLNGWMVIRGNTNYIHVYDFTINCRNATRAIYVDRTTFARVEQIDIYGNNSTQYAIAATSGSGCQAVGVRARDVEIVFDSVTSRFMIESCMGYGTNIGIRSRWGSNMSVTGSCPGGSTIENTSTGGRLWYGHVGNVGTDNVRGIEGVVNTWGINNGGGGTTPPPAPPQTNSWTASSSRSWRDVYGGWRTDNTYVYQSQWGGHGHHYGMWFFGNSVRSEVMNKNISRIRVRLSRRSEGGHSARTGAIIRSHNMTGQSGGRPSVSSYSVTANFSWGESRWVTLSNDFIRDFQNGNARGIAIYTDSRSTREYMIFNGNAQIEVTYR